MSSQPRMAAVIALVGLVGSTAVAQQTSEQGLAEPIADLSRCLPIAEAVERLTCLEGAARAIDASVRDGSLVVVDRSRIEEARRDAFGTSAASADILPMAGPVQPIDAIETTLTRATQGGDGRWIFTLADGSVWAQTDTDRVRNPDQPGAPVHVRRGALGSYLLVVGNSGAVRVRKR